MQFILLKKYQIIDFFVMVHKKCFKPPATVQFQDISYLVHQLPASSQIPKSVLDSFGSVIKRIKLCGLQHKFIILRFWRSTVLNGSQWAKFKLSDGGVLSASSEENLFPCVLSFLDSACIRWLVGPFPIFKTCNISPAFVTLLSLLVLFFPPLLFIWIRVFTLGPPS